MNYKTSKIKKLEKETYDGSKLKKSGIDMRSNKSNDFFLESLLFKSTIYVSENTLIFCL